MGFFNATVDLFILMLPIRMCWSIQLTFQRKIGLFAVFGLGVMYVSTFAYVLDS